jgi:hypothetical protein
MLHIKKGVLREETECEDNRACRRYGPRARGASAPAANVEAVIGKNVTIDIEPIAWRRGVTQAQAAGWKDGDVNAEEMQAHPADERQDYQRHMPRVTVYVDCDIPEYGKKN